MSAENAWRIAREAAEACAIEATDNPEWYRDDQAVGGVKAAEAIAKLPMPPAFRAEVEAEAEELRGMLAATLSRFESFKFNTLGDYYDPGKDADFAEARALLSRLEAKGESHE